MGREIGPINSNLCMAGSRRIASGRPAGAGATRCHIASTAHPWRAIPFLLEGRPAVNGAAAGGSGAAAIPRSRSAPRPCPRSRASRGHASDGRPAYLGASNRRRRERTERCGDPGYRGRRPLDSIVQTIAGRFSAVTVTLVRQADRWQSGRTDLESHQMVEIIKRCFNRPAHAARLVPGCRSIRCLRGGTCHAPTVLSTLQWS